MRYLELQNYRKFRKAAIEFPDGVIGVIGPNGTGKSTLIEAISWALYGNDAQRTRKEDVRWIGAQPTEECSVTLEFDLEDDRYRVRRQMRGSSLSMKVSLEINGQLHADGDRAVNQAISERLGMDYRAFFISVFARQKDLDALSVLPPRERRQLILRMLDIDVLDRIITSVRSDRKDLESQVKAISRILIDEEGRDRSTQIDGMITEIDGTIAARGKEVEGSSKELERLDERLSNLRKERDELGSREGDFHSLGRELAGRTSALEGLRASIGSLEAESSSLEKLRPQLDVLREKSELLERKISEKEEMDRERGVLKERKALQTRMDSLNGSIAPLESRIEMTEGSIKKMGDPTASLDAVSRNLEDLEVNVDAIRDEISQISAEIRGKEKERHRLRSRQEEISEMGPESNCPTCERRLGDQHEFLLEKMTSEIQDLEKTISLLKDGKAKKEEELALEVRRRQALEGRSEKLRGAQLEIVRLEQSLTGDKGRRDEIEREIDDISGRMADLEVVELDEEEYRRVRSSVEELKGPARKYSEVFGKMERLPKVLDDLEGKKNDLEELTEGIETLNLKLKNLDFDEDRLASIRNEIEDMARSREKAKEAISELRSDIRLKESKRESLVKERESLEESLEAKRENELEIGSLSTLEEVMGEFRTNLISRIVPTLSEISSSLFNEMTDSKYGGMEIDGDYNLSIFDGNETFGLERFSGGESDLANLCLRLAISRVIADRSGSSVDLLILDEIFGSQDQNRKRKVLSTFNRLSKKFRQIILITHIDDVKEFMEDVIYVNELEDGSSELVLEN